MPLTIKMKNLRRCPTLLPVFSDGLKGGKILLTEQQCIMPAGHDGAHRSASGGWLENVEGIQRLAEQGKL